MSWHPEDIKAAIRKKGVSLSELSLLNGLPDHACRTALYRPYFEAELAIAEFLSLSPRQIWPSRFDAEGTRRHHIRRPSKAITPAANFDVQRGRAA